MTRCWPSKGAAQAIGRIALLYKIEAHARVLDSKARLQLRLEQSKPLWEQLHLWLQLERGRVPDGSAIARAINFSLQSAKMHGHDPWAYLKDILTRMPTQLNSRIGECHRQTLINKRYR